IALQLANGLVEALIHQRDFARAEAEIRHALAEAARVAVKLPIDARPLHPELFRLRVALAQVLHRRGARADAEAEARATLADAERAWGLDEILGAAGQHTEAVTTAERAYTVVSARGDRTQPSLRYSAAFCLARALDTAGQTERAENLAEEARTLAAAASDTRTAATV